MRQDYDRLHHMLRVEHYEAQPVLTPWERMLLNQSRTALRYPWLARGSVDLTDTPYLKVLDQYSETVDSRETLPFVKPRASWFQSLVNNVRLGMSNWHA